MGPSLVVRFLLNTPLLVLVQRIDNRAEFNDLILLSYGTMTNNDKLKKSVKKRAFGSLPSASAWKPLDQRGLDLIGIFAGYAYPGNFPMQFKTRPGWYCLLITGGTGDLHFADKIWKVKRGDLFIISPSCASGWSGQKDQRLYLYFWHWLPAPFISFIKPNEGQYLHLQMTPSMIPPLIRLHANCREAVRNADHLIQFRLHKLRLETELLLAQNISKPGFSQSAIHFKLALHWIEEHMNKKRVIHALCCYLAISPATLERLFRRRLKMSPAVYLQKLKMERAKKLLQEGNLLVKQVSFSLGYKNHSSFTRAYKRHIGVNPREHYSTPGK